MIVNFLLMFFMLYLWLCIVQPIHILQYVLRLFRLNKIANLIGYIAWPFCWIINSIYDNREVLDDMGDMTIPTALALRSKYHMYGNIPVVKENTNTFSMGLIGHCYRDEGDFEVAKQIYLKRGCIFSWFLLTTQINGKQKDIDKYRATIQGLYNTKKYSEVVAFYEKDSTKSNFANEETIRQYIFSIWYSGNHSKAISMAEKCRETMGDKSYKHLMALHHEEKGELQQAFDCYRSADLMEEAKRISAIIDKKEKNTLAEINNLYNKKEYTALIDLFDKNKNIGNRSDGTEAVRQYVDAIHKTNGISSKLNSAILKYSSIKDPNWNKWQGEYYESNGDFVESAEWYKKAGLMQDYQRMLDKEEERKRIEEQKRIEREKQAAQELEQQGEFLKAAEHYKSAGLMQDYQRMLDKEEERKRIEEQKRREREKQVAQDMELQGDFLAAAEHYKSVKMTSEYDRCISQAVEQAKKYESNGLFGDAAIIFKALDMHSDYERVSQKEHDQKIARLKEKIKNERNNKAYSDVIKNVEDCPEVLDDEEIADCYLWSLWLHRGTEDKAVEMVGKYAQKFNTDRWESILGHYYAWTDDYQEALMHYKNAGMNDEIRKMEQKIEEERRRKEEEERRRREEEERRRKEEEERRRREEEEERRRREKEEASEKYIEYLQRALNNMDEDYCDKALEYAEKAGEGYDTKNTIENVKKAIVAIQEQDFDSAIQYFRYAGLPNWADQIEEKLKEESSYSSYGGSSSGCSECSNACAGSCGRSCSNGCGGSCEGCGGSCSSSCGRGCSGSCSSGCSSSCGGSCSYGGSGGRRRS